MTYENGKNEQDIMNYCRLGEHETYQGTVKLLHSFSANGTAYTFNASICQDCFKQAENNQQNLEAKILKLMTKNLPTPHEPEKRERTNKFYNAKQDF